MYWYVKVNGNILPTPYNSLSECLEACRQIQKELVSCITEPVLL